MIQREEIGALSTGLDHLLQVQINADGRMNVGPECSRARAQ